MSNSIRLRKLNITDIFLLCAIMTMTFTSGGNPHIQRIAVLVGGTGLLVLAKNRIRIRNVFIFLLLAVYIYVNSAVINIAPTDNKELTVMMIRLFCCMIIASSVTREKFKKLFLGLMVVLSLLSLVCFACMMLNIQLPGVTLKKGIYGAFYHTLSIGTGRQLERRRNSGIFTEPGVYQIYLNIALMILWSDRKMPLWKSKILFWLFSITMLTTKSSMGLILWTIVLVLYYIDRREILPNLGVIRRRDRVIIMFVFGVLVLLEEIFIGKGMGYIQNVSSWASRHDDTVLTFLISKEHPLFGTGLMTDPIPVWDVYYEKYAAVRLYTGYQNARSNGLGNMFADAGIPFALLYLFCIIREYVRLLEVKKTTSRILLAVLIIMFFMEEPIMTTPFFMICFFGFKENEKDMNRQTTARLNEKAMIVRDCTLTAVGE